ncbi:MAG: hypothetical protein AAF609_25935 [Cyanobacteria bacterium P01_C01_bin.120]
MVSKRITSSSDCTLRKLVSDRDRTLKIGVQQRDRSSPHRPRYR